MRCKYCLREMEPNGKCCPYCGKEQPATNELPQQNKKKKGNIPIIAAIVVVVVVIAALAVGIIMLLQSSSDKNTDSSSGTKQAQSASDGGDKAESQTEKETAEPTAAVKQNGTTGDCGWILYEDGTMVIEGSGGMADYGYTEAPWYEERQTVKKIIINEGVTAIGKYTFIDFENVSEVQFSKTVSTINEDAFYNCDSLATVNISSAVTSIGFNAFGSCNSLTDISVEADNPNYSSVDGSLFDKSGKTLILYAIGKPESSITLPDGVNKIYDDAFENSEHLSEITVPDSVTDIGKWVFEYCKNLKKITIPASVTAIGEKAFDNCSADLVIYGSEGSYAQSYAKDNGLAFSVASP